MGQIRTPVPLQMNPQRGLTPGARSYATGQLPEGERTSNILKALYGLVSKKYTSGLEEAYEGLPPALRAGITGLGGMYAGRQLMPAGQAGLGMLLGAAAPSLIDLAAPGRTDVTGYGPELERRGAELGVGGVGGLLESIKTHPWRWGAGAAMAMSPQARMAGLLGLGGYGAYRGGKALGIGKRRDVGGLPGVPRREGIRDVDQRPWYAKGVPGFFAGPFTEQAEPFYEKFWEEKARPWLTEPAPFGLPGQRWPWMLGGLAAGPTVARGLGDIARGVGGIGAGGRGFTYGTQQLMEALPWLAGAGGLYGAKRYAPEIKEFWEEKAQPWLTEPLAEEGIGAKIKPWHLMAGGVGLAAVPALRAPAALGALGLGAKYGLPALKKYDEERTERRIEELEEKEVLSPKERAELERLTQVSLEDRVVGVEEEAVGRAEEKNLESVVDKLYDEGKITEEEWVDAETVEQYKALISKHAPDRMPKEAEELTTADILHQKVGKHIPTYSQSTDFLHKTLGRHIPTASEARDWLKKPSFLGKGISNLGALAGGALLTGSPQARIAAALVGVGYGGKKGLEELKKLKVDKPAVKKAVATAGVGGVVSAPPAVTPPGVARERRGLGDILGKVPGALFDIAQLGTLAAPRRIPTATTMPQPLFTRGMARQQREARRRAQMPIGEMFEGRAPSAFAGLTLPQMQKNIGAIKAMFPDLTGKIKAKDENMIEITPTKDDIDSYTEYFGGGFGFEAGKKTEIPRETFDDYARWKGTQKFKNKRLELDRLKNKLATKRAEDLTPSEILSYWHKLQDMATDPNTLTREMMGFRTEVFEEIERIRPLQEKVISEAKRKRGIKEPVKAQPPIKGSFVGQTATKDGVTYTWDGKQWK